ncbi:MAG: protein kinase [Clostridia bacterium]|jgi:serine/threonine protein kinase|nr:protein kinase [Clostridia bacterium]
MKSGNSITQEVILIKNGMKLNNKYVILKKISNGYISEVYLAKHIKFGYKVILKMAYDNCVIENEVRVMNKINSNFIPKVLDLFYYSGILFAVIQYIEGKSLDSISKKTRELNKILISILKVLEEIHNSKVIHLDLKPSNIIVSRENIAYIIDFGSSKLFGDKTTKRYFSKGYTDTNKKKLTKKNDIYAIKKVIKEFGIYGIELKKAETIKELIRILNVEKTKYLGSSNKLILSTTETAGKYEVANNMESFINEKLGNNNENGIKIFMNEMMIEKCQEIFLVTTQERKDLNKIEKIIQEIKAKKVKIIINKYEPSCMLEDNFIKKIKKRYCVEIYYLPNIKRSVYLNVDGKKLYRQSREYNKAFHKIFEITYKEKGISRWDIVETLEKLLN